MKKLARLFGGIKTLIKKNNSDNVAAISAQSAFFIIMSVVPFLMFAFAVLSMLNIPQNIFDSYFDGILPQKTNDYIRNILQETYQSSVGVAFTGIIVALWSSGKGLYSITEGIRRIYRLDNKNWLLKRIYAMGYTLIMFLVFLIAFGVLVLSEFFDDVIRPFIKNLPYSVEILYTLRYLIVFVLLVLLTALALKVYLRNKVEDKRWSKFRVQLPGAVISAVGWILLTLGIRVYVDNFNGFSVYGSLGTAVVLMMWIYFSMYIFLFAVQINYVFKKFFYYFKIKNIFKKTEKSDENTSE